MILKSMAGGNECLEKRNYLMFRPTQQWVFLKLVTHSPVLHPAISRMKLQRGTNYTPLLKAILWQSLPLSDVYRACIGSGLFGLGNIWQIQRVEWKYAFHYTCTINYTHIYLIYKNTVVPPSPQGTSSRTPSRCLTPQIVLNPAYAMVFLVRVHTYLFTYRSTFRLHFGTCELTASLFLCCGANIQ